MMRAVPNRVLPLLVRYGSVLLAALLVYFVIREPVAVAFGAISFTNDARKSSLRASGGGVNKYGIPISEIEDIDTKPPMLGPAAAAAEEDIRDQQQQEQTPMGDDVVRHEKFYKPEPERYPPIEDHFPYLTYAGDAPPVLDNNLPPNPHVDEKTPLLIGFTRNWPMLLQCVSSYVAAGWPPSDIYVVENTGTFRANRQQELSLQNAFFLNHTALRKLGVNVMATPTLLSFAQLQNFFLHAAQQRDWPFFFWSHQDVLAFSDEEVRKKDRDHDWDHDPYATIYERCVGLLRYINGPDMPPWATHFFAYDQLALVNRDAHLDVGAWDVHIPYRAADCDMYLRLHWAGYWQPQSEAGLVFDVGVALDDIGALFRLPGSHATFQGDPVFGPLDPMARPHQEADLKRERDMYRWVDREGESYPHLIEVAARMQDAKWEDRGGAGGVAWQARQRGGQGELFYRDPDGFGAGLDAMDDAGRRTFADKWGHRGCDLLELGIEGKDAWRLERDWDINEAAGNEGGNWEKDWMAEA